VQKNTLRQLQRGLYASRNIEVGELIDLTNTYAAIPVQDNQFITNEISIWQNFVSQKKISKDEPIDKSKVLIEDNRGALETILSDTRTMVLHSGITINRETDIEISHHYGLDKFNAFGAVLITLLNREYAKKLVIMKKNQIHPEHFHKLKEETFVVITGRLEVQLNGTVNTLHPGDVLVIPRESLHSMIALDDCVFEEISSTNYADDSFYSDSEKLLQNRKTSISLWF
jgi:quercetin dioxygenase-like cupin family protein